ncbi:hypothetical protein STHERM_c01920 [Spirochaeta thermophila DSM 6192]|uniref:Uncharacterized protein n=3 Tax=Winmispira thermophila TaxID=154 RepID=G0GCP4_WINT7|nr:hypothetical protein STHERM_c01920 [Spirochaeta thermophila DSM 6192]AEJ60463.1 hypothetical protein Spith_0176 [Spirochaeta thermophila DSM 6578]
MGKSGSTLSSREKKKKIYCANCIHCKVSAEPTGGGYLLRVRCAAGKWRKKMGAEKLYRLSTVMRRVMTECEAYEPMGDEEEFLRELKKTLPVQDDPYEISS